MRTPIIPAALVAAIALGTLTACIPDPDPLAQEIATFPSLDTDAVASLSGSAQAIADRFVMEAVGMPDEPFPLAAAPELTGGPGFAVSTTVADAAESLAFTTIFGMLVDKLGDARTTDERLEGASEEGDNRTFSFSVENGRLVGTTSQSVAGGGDGLSANAAVTTKFDVAACPAADGSVSATVSFQSRGSAAKSGGDVAGEQWGAFDFAMTATGMVGDDAQLAYVDLGSTAEVTSGLGATKGDESARGGMNFASAWEYRLSYSGGEPGDLDTKGLPRITRSSQAVGALDQANLLKATAQYTYSMATTVFLVAQEHWRSGACVRMGIAADADIPTVEKDSSTSVTVSPVAKSDSAPTGGTIVAERQEGAGTITPTDAQPSPGEYTYRAPNTDDTTIVVFTATSKRGVGILPQKFQTSVPGWVIDENINGIRTYGLKCGSLSGEWEIASSGGGWYQASTIADIDFEAGSGEYSISGVADGYGFSGGGLVTVETLPDGTIMVHFLPGEANYLGNGDFVVKEAPDICS